MTIVIRRRVGIGSSLLALSLVGCNAFTRSTRPEVVVPAQDTSFLAGFLRDRMSMRVVFPPREDLRVGDMFLTAGRSGLAGPLMGTPRWDSIDLNQQIAEEYSVRRELPATPLEYVNPPEDPLRRAWPEAAAAGDLFRDQQAVVRLRTVSLPPVQLTRARFEEALPVDAVNLALAGGEWDWNSVVLRMQAAESYAVDTETLLDHLVDEVRPEDQEPASLVPGGAAAPPPAPRSRFYLKPEMRDRLALFPSGDVPTVWMHVVTEVLYMRAMQVSVSCEAEEEPETLTMAQLGQDDDEDEGEESEGEAPAEPVKEEPEDEDEVLDPAYAAIVRAQAINEVLRDSGGDLLPDSQVRFQAIGKDFLSYQRVFQRGIALGARGITMEVDWLTGEVLHFDWLGTH